MLQNSFGSAPLRNVLTSFFGHLAVARRPESGQIIIVTLPLVSGEGARVGSEGCWPSGGSVPSCHVLARGVGEGFGRPLLFTSESSSGIGRSERFGTVPTINSSTRRNSGGTFVTYTTFGSVGGGSS